MKSKKSTPSDTECYQLWEDYHVPDNIREHIRQVTRISLWLAGQLQNKGYELDIQLVESGALLHDLCRLVGEAQINLKYFVMPPTPEDMVFWQELNNKYNPWMQESPHAVFASNPQQPLVKHAPAAALELLELGYPLELARVVERHRFSSIVDPEDAPSTWEEKIVYYADKRVAHDKIVTLDERFTEGDERYPQYANEPGEQLKRQAIRDLEKEIWDIVGTDPDELASQVAVIET